MARTKKQRKKKKKKKNISIRAEVIFQLMITTIFFMIILDMEGGDKEAAFLIGTILLMLAGIPSTKQLNIWTR